jgi:hypothetical protein
MEFAFGSGVLWASRSDIANATPVRFGALQDVTIDFDGEMKELFGQYKYPIDVAAGKAKITGKAKAARISTVQFNSIFFGQTTTAGQKLVSYDETGTVASGGTIAVANAGTNFFADLGARNGLTGEPLVLSGGTVGTTGTYVVNNTGTYNFGTGAAGNTMILDYIYSTVATGTTMLMTNQPMGYAPRFGCTFTNQYEGNTVTLRLFACLCSKLNMAGKIDDYIIPEFDFSAYANAANQVFEFSSTT